MVEWASVGTCDAGLKIANFLIVDFEIMNLPTLNTYQALFLWRADNVGTSWLSNSHFKLSDQSKSAADYTVGIP
jgi:hypothetical protein